MEKCKYCNNEGMIQWHDEEMKALASYENGVLSIGNEAGDEMIIEFDFCPMCGEKIKR